MKTVISVENLSKCYRLGEIGSGTLIGDINRWWAKLRGHLTEQEKFGAVDHGYRHGEEIWALRDVSLQVKKGEVLGIVGSNGAGKSTLLKILSKITAPTSGRALMKGRVGSLLEVGTGFHPELTGRENIFLNGSILGMSRLEVDSRLDEIVSFAEVEKFVDTPVRRYSSGMIVRLAFAVAAHLEPEILIVDEVLAVGDLAFRKKCLGAMNDLSQSGKTVLFVSHNVASIRSLCGRAIWLEKGEIKIDDEVNYVVDSYLTENVTQTTDGYVLKSSAQEATHDFYIDRIEVYDLEHKPKEIIRTWDGVIFKIVFASPADVKNGSVVFKLSTMSGTVLSLHSTKPDKNEDFNFEQGLNSIDLVIKKLPLSAGDFVIGVALAVPWREILCDESEFCVITVYDKDVYKSGLAPRSDRYHIALEYEWRNPMRWALEDESGQMVPD